MSRNCSIEYCENEVTHKKADICTACYSSMYYWGKKKSPTDILTRKKKLRVYAARLAALQPALIPMKLKTKVRVR